MTEKPHKDANALVDELTAATQQHMDKPFAIFGHSMGALLAFAWAQRLETQRVQPNLLIVSGRNTPHEPSETEPLHLLDDDELVEALRIRFGASQGDLLRDAELRSIFLPILRADLQVVDSYRFCRQPSLGSPLMAAGGRQDPSVSTAGLEGWRGLTRGQFSCFIFEGDHYYLHGEGREALVTTMVQGLLL